MNEVTKLQWAKIVKLKEIFKLNFPDPKNEDEANIVIDHLQAKWERIQNGEPCGCRD